MTRENYGSASTPMHLSHFPSEGKTEILRKLDQRIETCCEKRFASLASPKRWLTMLNSTGAVPAFGRACQLASQYAVPEQHRRYRRLHVRITWRTSDGQMVKVPGPICIGGGKYSGLGLFAALDETS